MNVGRVGHPSLPAAAGRAAAPPDGARFGTELARAAGQLQLSRHAQKRVERRSLDLTPAQLGRLNAAVGRAAEKGARNSVVMLDDLALVVDVRGRTVVTAMHQRGGEGRVFTNVDSVVIA
ncbi:MAG: hypothetical protein Kow0010_09150 [Dehalococcoidia bacterium]